MYTITARKNGQIKVETFNDRFAATAAEIRLNCDGWITTSVWEPRRA